MTDEHDDLGPLMLVVQHYAFAVAKRDTTHAEGSHAYAEVRRVAELYGAWQRASGSAVTESCERDDACRAQSVTTRMCEPCRRQLTASHAARKAYFEEAEG